MERTNAASMLAFCILIFPGVMLKFAYPSVIENPAWLALDPFKAIMRIAHDLLPPVPGANADIAHDIPLSAAWRGILAWIAAGFVLLAWRTRKVEVVT